MPKLELRSTSLLALLALTSAAAVRADGIEVDLSDDTARAAYVAEIGDNGLELDFGYLHQDGGADVGSVGAQVVGYRGQGRKPVRAGIGARAFFIDEEQVDGGAVALGGLFLVPIGFVEHLGVGGHVWWGPSVASFGDAEKVLEWAVRVEYRVVERAGVYVGYRRIRAEFDQTPVVTVESGLHAGVNLRW